MYAAKKDGEYFVEFPPEGYDDPTCLKNSLHDKDEKELATAMSKALVLKRPRECNAEEGDCEGSLSEKAAKKGKMKQYLCPMAEEVGLTTPPTSK